MGRLAAVLISLALVVFVQNLPAQTTAFNYQGRLTEAGNPANGAFQMQFKLFDSLGGGGQVGSTITNVPVTVTAGVFTVKLDFGLFAFSGANRWLEIAVRHNSSESYVTFAPREQIGSSPVATSLGMPGGVYSYMVEGVFPGPYPTLGFNTYSTPNPITYRAGREGFGGVFQYTNGDGKLTYYTAPTVVADAPFSFTQRFTIDREGRVGIGTVNPTAGLEINGFARLQLTNRGAGQFQADPTIYFVNTAATWFAGVRSVNNGFGIAYDTGPAELYRLFIDTSGNVGINTTTPARMLHVNGRARVGQIPLEAWDAHVCFNVAGDLLDCNFSSLRAKTNVRSFRPGLDIVRRLRPISFDWKENGRPGVGLGAEDVAKVEPSLVETNDKNEVTGVKYERLNMLLINAVKEQQAQIERIQKQLDAVKKQLCRTSPRALVCREKGR